MLCLNNWPQKGAEISKGLEEQKKGIAAKRRRRRKRFRETEKMDGRKKAQMAQNGLNDKR